MPNDESLCVKCARHQRTCCQDTEVYVTLGDVERIADFAGRQDFFEFIAPSSLYSDQDDDPMWRDQVFRKDGTRRVLRHQSDGDCTFLAAHGCTLPSNVRPLVCRLFPFDYTANGILDEPVDGCPLALLAPGRMLLPGIGMERLDAQRWHEQLYAEIALDKHESTEKTNVTTCTSD